MVHRSKKTQQARTGSCTLKSSQTTGMMCMALPMHPENGWWIGHPLDGHGIEYVYVC